MTYSCNNNNNNNITNLFLNKPLSSIEEERLVSYLLSIPDNDSVSNSSSKNDHYDRYDRYDGYDPYFLYNVGLFIDQIYKLNEFVCPNLLYIDSSIFADLGYGLDAWKYIIYSNLDADIFSDEITLSDEIRAAMFNINNNSMTYNDLIIHLMYKNNLSNIGTWIDNYIDNNIFFEPKFRSDFTTYLLSLGYSKVYADTSFKDIMRQIKS